MAKGGNNQKNNGSRFTKPYDASNSFVKKVAQRVSGYLGGWFGTPSKLTDESAASEGAPVNSGDSTLVSHRCLDSFDASKATTGTGYFENLDSAELPAKRMKIASKGKYDIDFPISPIPSTSGLFPSSSSTVNHNFSLQNNDTFLSVAGPSGLQSQRFTNTVDHTSTASTELKANGANDDHSESSESTSGCSSLVPQSDRLSRSAYVCSSRKKNLEEKLNYARQLKQSRTSLYLNRSIPVCVDSSIRRKPSFDVSAYGTPIFDKSSVKEKMVTSPFYSGQTSYGGASAYRRSKCTLYPQRNTSLNNSWTDRKEGLQVQVKPSHHGSTEDLSNMSHTAKRILEALEQFSTPVNDAKRIPVNTLNPPLGSKRKRFEDLSESRLRLSTSKTPLNTSTGPSITGLNVPTVPDLLKLKRLERIQNSTAAAREVAVQKQEYSLPNDTTISSKRSGKIVTKLKNKEKSIPMEKPEEVSLPKISLPITTLPKFDLKLQPMPVAQVTLPKRPSTTSDVISCSSANLSNTNVTTAPKTSISTSTSNSTTTTTAFFGSRNFTFSPPITLSDPLNLVHSFHSKSNFTFSHPLNPTMKKDVNERTVASPLTNFMSNEAVSKLKRRSGDNLKSFGVESNSELKTGSVMDVLGKNNASDIKVEIKPFGEKFKPSPDTWECTTCLIRNLNDNKNCAACMTPKPTASSPKTRTSLSVTNDLSNGENKSFVTPSFGNQLKSSGSLTCKECNNNPTVKCSTCKREKINSKPVKDVQTETKPTSSGTGFGDIFKKKAGQWECSVCMIQNKENDMKCVACENPKPGAKIEKPEPPKFNFGIPPGGGGFKFGIDQANENQTSETKSKPNGPLLNLTKPIFDNTVSTSVGVFTFGIPPTKSLEKTDGGDVKSLGDSQKNSPNTHNDVKVDSSKSPKVLKPSNGGFSLPLSTESKVLGTPAWGSNPLSQSIQSDKKDEKGKKVTEAVTTDFAKKKTDAPKPFIFGSPDKTLKKSSSPPADKKLEVSTVTESSTTETSLPKFSFGNTNAPQTTPFQIKQVESGSKSLGSTGNQKSSSSVPITSAPPASFGFTSAFNDPGKIAFGSKENTSAESGIKSNNSFFGNGNSLSTGTQFGSTAFGSAVGFNGPTTTTTSTAASAFGQTTSPPKGSGFGQHVGTIPAFGQAITTSTNSAFGQPATSTTSTFGQAGTTKSNAFGQTTSSTSSAFDKIYASTPSAFGQNVTPAASTFGPNVTSTSSAFGQPPTSTTTAFGQTSASATTPFGQSSTLGGGGFGQTSTANAFGQATTASSGFGTNTTQAFSSTFGTASTAFANPTTTSTQSSATPTPTRTPFRSFGSPVPSFGTSTPTPTPAFGSTSANTGQTFGSGFSASATPTTPFKAATPFIFGSNSDTSATPNAAPAQNPNVFTFGASKTEAKPSPFGSNFGQNGAQPFAFGTPSTQSIFGGFGQPKADSPFAAPNSTFGNSAPISFGQNSAPASFVTPPPSFDFGANNSQPQTPAQPQPQPFQFGATVPQQPSTPATNFSLQVPPSFNFTGGQTPTFSANPTSVQPSNPNRKVIKAVRRTQQTQPR